MALGFIKKIFSFGKKEVEEVPAEEVLHGEGGSSQRSSRPMKTRQRRKRLPVADVVEAIAAEQVEDRAAFAEREAIDERVPASEMLTELEPARRRPGRHRSDSR